MIVYFLLRSPLFPILFIPRRTWLSSPLNLIISTCFKQIYWPSSLIPVQVFTSICDFVGPITPLPEPRTLGVMAHGIPIYGIGIVQWIFHTRDTTLTIHDPCYYVPNDRTCLLIPQQLLGSHGGATGTFTIGGKCATLSLDGKPYIRYEWSTPTNR